MSNEPNDRSAVPPEGGADGKGTGGLTLGPPPAQTEDAGDIGFAPDLMGSTEGAPLPEAPSSSTPVGEVGAHYPRALAAIAVLLGEADELSILATLDGGDLERGDLERGDLERGDLERGDLERSDLERSHLHSGGIDLGPPPGLAASDAAPEALPERLEVGPAITRRKHDVRRPPPPRANDDEVDTSEPMEDLVEMVLVGGEDGEAPSVHLMFKQDTFDGMYLKLERTPEGLFARFQVKDASTRRAVAGHVDMMLSRLRDKGMRIAGHDIVVEKAEK